MKTRRSLTLFLLTAAAGLAATAPHSPLRVAIIGLVHGHAGGFLGGSALVPASGANHRSDVQIVGVVESDQKLFDSYAKKYQWPGSLHFTSIQEVAARAHPDAALVFTSTAGHLKAVQQCAAAGIHVMMEKPMAVSYRDALAMAEAAHYAFEIATAVWGGAAGARLGSNLREDKGYSYGVFSFPRLYSKYGTWIAQGGVQTNKTKESVVEFEKELRLIAGQKPVSETELKTARDYRVRGYAQQFESLDRVTGQIAQLWSLSLPVSELQRELQKMETVDLSAVNGAAEKYATPANSSLLLVGDASKIEAGVRQLNVGELVLLDPEGSPLQSRDNVLCKLRGLNS